MPGRVKFFAVGILVTALISVERGVFMGGRRKSEGDSKKKKVVTPKEELKLEIASELGLLEKVNRDGWESLTLAECGRIGGILARRMKELNIGG